MRRSLSERWKRVRTHYSLNDLMFEASGKTLIGLGTGALLAAYISSSAWFYIGFGLVVVLIVKLKHWSRFWES